MKKLALFILLLGFAFTLLACQTGENTPTVEDPTTLPDEVTLYDGQFRSAGTMSGGVTYYTIIQLHEDGTYYLSDFNVISVGEYEVKDESYTYSVGEDEFTVDRTITFDGSKTYGLVLREGVHVIAQFPNYGGMWNGDLIQDPEKADVETAVSILTYYDINAIDGAYVELMSDFTFTYWENGMTLEDTPYTGTWSKTINDDDVIVYTLTTSDDLVMTLLNDDIPTLSYNDTIITLSSKNPLDIKTPVILLSGIGGGDWSWAQLRIEFYADGTYQVILTTTQEDVYQSGTYALVDPTNYNYNLAMQPESGDAYVINLDTTTLKYTHTFIATLGDFTVDFELAQEDIVIDKEVSLTLRGEKDGWAFADAYFYADNTFSITMNYAGTVVEAAYTGTYDYKNPSAYDYSLVLTFSDETTAEAIMTYDTETGITTYTLVLTDGYAGEITLTATISN